MIFLFIILIISSAFFSASEIAYFNIKKHQKTSNATRLLLSKPRELLTFILISNTLINIAIGSLSANYTLNVLSKYYLISTERLLFIEVIIVTLIVLIFGEIIPKTMAIKRSIHFANIISHPMYYFFLVSKPLFFIFYKFSDFLVKISPFKKEQIFDSEEELKMLTEIVEKEGTIQQTESDMIQSVFEFNDKLVKEILTPRVDIIAIDSTSSIDDAMDLITNKKFSKIPVYKDSIDNIIGILYAKDIIPYLIGSRPKINLKKLSRAPFYIPETKPIDDLLDDFKNKKKNIAIAVDEWGGTSGLITLEDIIEEVMGELSDPYDNEEYSFKEIEKGVYIVEGSIKIYDLEENIDIEFPDIREYDTLAGYILDSIGEIPSIGQGVKFNNYQFTVLKITKNRIDKVEIKKSEK
tara:strand:+ start:752 stop:1978 length:1227 start_codon:yes stop_codon:yes gene_type:complete